MEVLSLVQSVLSSRTAAAYQDAQVSVLKKAMDSQAASAAKLLDSMALPLATEGPLGTHVNTYA